MRIVRLLHAASTWWITHTSPAGVASASVLEREQLRKAHLLSVGSFFCLLMSLPLLFDELFIHASSSVLVMVIFDSCIVSAILLNRAARFNLASLVFIGGYLITGSWGFLWSPAVSHQFYLYGWVHLVLPLIFAGHFLPFWAPLLIALLDCGIITAIELLEYAHEPGVWSLSAVESASFFLYIYVMLLAIAIISAVYARSVEQAVLKADRAAEVEQAHAELRTAYAKLEHLATIDPITGLLNHREMNTQLAMQEEYANRTGQAFGLIFADIDHFKQVNDTRGHQVGDEVLAHVGALLRDHVRAHDQVARYGGEEFVILLPGQSLAEAVQTAERLRVALANSPVRLPDGDDLTITLSMGVSDFPADAISANQLITAADAAMYHAKRNGRNRVCSLVDLAAPSHAEQAA